MLNRLILTNLFYFKSNWVDIRAAAPMFIGKAAGVLLSRGFAVGGVLSPGRCCPRNAFGPRSAGRALRTSRAAGNGQVFWCLHLVRSASLRLAVPRLGDGHACHVPGWCQHPRNFSPATSH